MHLVLLALVLVALISFAFYMWHRGGILLLFPVVGAILGVLFLRSPLALVGGAVLGFVSGVIAYTLWWIGVFVVLSLISIVVISAGIMVVIHLMRPEYVNDAWPIVLVLAILAITYVLGAHRHQISANWREVQLRKSMLQQASPAAYAADKDADKAADKAATANSSGNAASRHGSAADAASHLPQAGVSADAAWRQSGPDSPDDD